MEQGWSHDTTRWPSWLLHLCSGSPSTKICQQIHKPQSHVLTMGCGSHKSGQWPYLKGSNTIYMCHEGYLPCRYWCCEGYTVIDKTEWCGASDILPLRGRCASCNRSMNYSVIMETIYLQLRANKCWCSIHEDLLLTWFVYNVHKYWELNTMKAVEAFRASMMDALRICTSFSKILQQN